MWEYCKSVEEFIGATEDKNTGAKGPLWAIRYREVMAPADPVPNDPTSFFSEVSCLVCGSRVNVVNHHISYFPEFKIPLCRKCHIRWHKAHPYMKRPKKF